MLILVGNSFECQTPQGLGKSPFLLCSIYHLTRSCICTSSSSKNISRRMHHSCCMSKAKQDLVRLKGQGEIHEAVRISFPSNECPFPNVLRFCGLERC